MPEEWKKNPDLILTTADLMEAMRQQIMFIEKSTPAVKEKRLKALLSEVSLLYDDLNEETEKLRNDIQSDLAAVRQNIKENNKKYYGKASVQAIEKLAVTPQRALITPEFISKGQNSNPKLYNIIMTLRTKPKHEIPKQILKKYRILNDSFLITRANKSLPFDSPGNIRLVCDSKMTIQILSLIHVTNCHFGMNLLYHIFQHTYKCIEGSTQSYVKLVCTGCRSCQFVRTTNKKVVPAGRIPYPSMPNHTWCVDFMVFKDGHTFNGKKVDAAFNIMDLYSGFLISHLTTDQTAKTVIDCLKKTFAIFNSPVRILSDNASAICKSPEVLHFLKTSNVKIVSTITSHNSKANKVERLQKLLRDTIKLVQETFRRQSPFDLYYSIIQMLNNRPLTLALHPNVKQICKDMNTTPGVVTPYSLQFGIPPPTHSSISLEDSLQPEDRGAFGAKWQHIIETHDKMLQNELEERQKDFNNEIIEVGDLVLITDEVRHKEQLRYYKEIFEVIRIEKAKYYCVPLFKNLNLKQKVFEVNGNRLKKYHYSELFDVLPSKVRVLMGENLSPEQLRDQAEKKPGQIPSDLHDWRQWRPPNVISLRNRISPPDKMSQPALSLAETDVFSDSTGKSSGLSIPDSIPDSISEVSSILSRNNLMPQIRTSKERMITTQPRMQPLPIQKRKEGSLKHTATTLEQLEQKLKEKKLKTEVKKDLRHKFRQAAQDIEGIGASSKKISKPSFGNISPISEKVNRNQTTYPTIIPDCKSPEQTLGAKTAPSNDSTFGANVLVNNVVRELVNQLKDPIEQYLKNKVDTQDSTILNSPSQNVTSLGQSVTQSPQVSPSLLANISDIGRRLRSRSKLMKPLRFRDPNFTK
jgi:hypothetical protein